MVPWNLCKLLHVLSTPEKTVAFCKDRGLIADKPRCRYCWHHMSWSTKRGIDKFTWRCHNRRCKKRSRTCSLRHGSWFSSSNLSLRKILVLTYCWSVKMSNKAAMRESSLCDDVKTSSSTVVNWFTFCREICLHVVQQNNNAAIGGPGKVVELDESQFGKHQDRKNNRKLNGKWLLGGICRESNEVFLLVVKQRNSATFISLIKEHVAAGSTVATACLKSYDCANRESLEELTVNHSLNFIDRSTISKKQRCLWWQVKKGLTEDAKKSSSSTASDAYGFRLAEHMWRSRNEGSDQFEQLLTDILLLYKPTDFM